jgi:hypothetical protein
MWARGKRKAEDFRKAHDATQHHADTEFAFRRKAVIHGIYTDLQGRHGIYRLGGA